MPKSVILCVDDEVVILDSLKMQLKREFGDNYFYEMAESADEALEILDELSEDEVNILLLVSDWLMPGMRGDEFLVLVHQKFPKTIKIMLTGQADSEAIERAVNEANLFRCLCKPWDGKELLKTIRLGLELAKNNG
jgi:DNA-binding NtrC family response regulator